jgi:hypothetical protein
MGNKLPVEFPRFKQIDLEDRGLIQDLLWKYQPETSELTFTNLFIWRAHYGVIWSLYKDLLLLVFDRTAHGAYVLPPIGVSSRQEATRRLLHWLEEKGEDEPRIERADQRLAGELAGATDLVIGPTRDDFDYVYSCQDLVRLAGRKYHAKRNFINTFQSIHQFSYEALTQNHISACLELAAKWCQLHRCDEDLNLTGEWVAIREALTNFGALQLQGGVIRLASGIEAFALGELLNSETAVVHIEKANPAIRGLYAVINQQFCQHNWEHATFVNREQDLGLLPLRQAKLSYHPHHLVEKFRIRLSSNS